MCFKDSFYLPPDYGMPFMVSQPLQAGCSKACPVILRSRRCPQRGYQEQSRLGFGQWKLPRKDIWQGMYTILWNLNFTKSHFHRPDLVCTSIRLSQRYSMKPTFQMIKARELPISKVSCHGCLYRLCALLSLRYRISFFYHLISMLQFMSSRSRRYSQNMAMDILSQLNSLRRLGQTIRTPN